MTESGNQEANRKKLPLQMILVTSNVSRDYNDVFNDDEFGIEEEREQLENSPTLTVQYNGQEYEIVLGAELIKNAFNRAFSLLGMDSVTVIKTNVELQQVNTNSNSR